RLRQTGPARRVPLQSRAGRGWKEMLLILIIAVIALAGAAGFAYAVHRQNLLPYEGATRELPPEPTTLFGDDSEAAQSAGIDAADGAAVFLARVEQGDLEVLESTRQQTKLYAAALDRLIDFHERQGEVTRLVKYITKSDDLRGSPRLAERVIGAWKDSPDR